jgi:hypothetical protein
MRGGKRHRCAVLVSQFYTLSVKDLWQLVLQREGPRYGLVGSISEMESDHPRSLIPGCDVLRALKEGAGRRFVMTLNV